MKVASTPQPLYIEADRTGHTSLVSPVQDKRIPCYLGSSAGMPKTGGSFVRGRKWMVCEMILSVGHQLNPFDVPLIVSRSMTKEERGG